MESQVAKGVIVAVDFTNRTATNLARRPHYTLEEL